MLSSLLIFGADLYAQEQHQPSLSLKQRVDRGLSRSDLQAFLEASKALPKEAYELNLAVHAAGSSKDPFWIPYLKPLDKKRERNGENIGRAAQLALAKLGEAEQLQEITCEADFGSPSMRDHVVRWDLPYLKGWFSIHLLTRWLDESYKEDDILHDRPGDQVFDTAHGLAVVGLSNLLPDAPIRKPAPGWSSDVDYAPIRQAWREWIEQNEESLRKLSPTGEGLDISRPTCKIVLAHDRHIDRSRLTK